MIESIKLQLVRSLILSGVISLGLLYVAYRFIIGKEQIKGNKKVARAISIFMAVLLVTGSIFLSFDLVLDCVDYNPNLKTAKVVGIITTFSGDIHKSIILDDKNEYRIFLNNPKMDKDKTYKIIFLPRSKIILYAEEL